MSPTDTITMPIDMDILVISVNSPIDLSGIFSNVAVILVNGTINCDATLPPGGTIDLNLTNGSTDLNIPEFSIDICCYLPLH